MGPLVVGRPVGCRVLVGAVLVGATVGASVGGADGAVVVVVGAVVGASSVGTAGAGTTSSPTPARGGKAMTF